MLESEMLLGNNNALDGFADEEQEGVESPNKDEKNATVNATKTSASAMAKAKAAQAGA